MAVTTVQHTDISQQLAGLLEGIEGLRVYWYISDSTRPSTNGGAVVIGQPEIDWLDTLSGFCESTFTFPLTVLVARNNDREAQLALSRLVQAIAHELSTTSDDQLSVEPMDARPTAVSIGQTELPAYLVNVRVRA